MIFLNTGECYHKIIIQKRVEARCQIAADDLVASNPDLVKCGLDELTLGLFIGVHVGAGAGLDQQQRMVECFLEVGGVCSVPFKRGFGIE